MKKSVFFDFFNRQSDTGFKVLLSDGRENIDYINWNDFLLPASYGDSQEEYQAIRNECALFDLSPMRKIHLSGTAAGTLLDTVLTRPVSAMQSMRGGYVAFCDVDGMLKDDSILYEFSDEHFLLGHLILISVCISILFEKNYALMRMTSLLRSAPMNGQDLLFKVHCRRLF